jgi:hypothetical protein
MLFVSLGSVRAGTDRERIARRMQWSYPEGYIYSDSRCYSMVLVNWPSRRATAASELQSKVGVGGNQTLTGC